MTLAGDSFHTRYYHSEGREADAALSVVAGPAFFQYAVFDKDFTRLTEMAHVEGRDRATLIAEPDQLAFLLQNHSLSGKNFSRANVALLHADFVMMPAAYAGQQHAREALHFSSLQAESVTTFVHQVKDIEFCCGHAHMLMQVVEQAFSNASVRHAGAVTINLLSDHQALQECHALLVVHAGMIEIALRRNGAIVFYNVFPVTGTEDILYYLLFAAEQFAFDPATLHLAVAGLVPHTSDLVAYLKRYTARLSFASNPAGFKAAGKLGEIPAHYYFTLLNQHLCEL